MPKVSVIIPVYNVEKYITQALDSVVNQTLADIEIICVNDCTPDKSFEIVKEYALKDKRFSLLELELNQGQGVARNKALEIAKGDYIMFLDPDDWLELDACEKAYNQISKNNNEMVFFNLYKFNENKNMKKEFRLLKRLYSIKDNLHIDLKTFDMDWLRTCWTWRIIYSKEFLQKNDIKYAELKMNEDVPFFVKAVCCSDNVSLLDEFLYNYRVKKSVQTTDYSQYFEDIIGARKIAFDYVKQTNSDYLEKTYISYQIRTIMNWAKKFSKNNESSCEKNYEQMHNYLVELNNAFDVSKIKNAVDYDRFSYIISNKTYKEYIKSRRFLKSNEEIKCQQILIV